MNDEYRELAVYLLMVIDDCRSRMNPNEYVSELIGNILRVHTRIVDDKGAQSIADILKDMGFEG